MSVALITIATGAAYHKYAKNMIESALCFFPEATPVVFTDEPTFVGFEPAEMIFETPAKGYPTETLQRYSTILSHEHSLAGFDYLYYVDADMEFVAPVGDIYSDGLVATLHPGYVGRRGTPETRPESRAFCVSNTAYYCGGFQGGDSMRYITAMTAMKNRIDADAFNGITAVWHDESHWNAFLAHFPPSKVLSPSYCYPEDYNGRWGWKPEDYKPILMALNKNKRGGR